MRQLPAITYAHSASLCQCSSRMPPGVRRMFTPAISVAIGSSRVVDLPCPPAAQHAVVRQRVAAT